MRPSSKSWLLAALTAAALISPFAHDAVSAQALPRGIPRPNGGPQAMQNRDGYNRGYSEGTRQGELDGRRGRPFEYSTNPAFRNADRGYDQRNGNRQEYVTAYRNGFVDGYRSGYNRYRTVNGPFGRPNPGGTVRQIPRGYQEPAIARGYADGYEQGLQDSRDRDRYDPVGSRDYRDGEDGYYSSYGSREAYRNNYRTGFRQGYDAGYREVRR